MARFLPLDGMKMQIVRNEIEEKPRSSANDIVIMLDFVLYIAKNEKREMVVKYIFVEDNYAERICGRGSSSRFPCRS